MPRKKREFRKAKTGATQATGRISSLQRILDQTAEKAIYAIILLVPVTFLPNAYWPFDISKITLLRILTIIALCAYLSGAAYSRQLRIVRPPVVWPVILYVAVYALASIFSISVELSLYSGEGRNFGLLSLVNMVVLYFLVINVLVNRAKLINGLRLLVASCSIIALLGIFQFYEISVQVMKPMMGYRTSSTFGNPDFLFSFLTLGLPVVCAYIVERRWFYLFPLFLILFGIILSVPPMFGTAGDLFLSLLAAGVVLAILIAYRLMNRRRWALCTSGLASSFILVMCLLIVFNVGSVRDHADEYVISHFGGPGSDRDQLASFAMEAFTDYPVLGSGPNTFRNTFTEYATLKYAQERPERREDKVHNSFAEAAATTGILGLITYVLMYGALFWYFLRWLRRNRGNREWVFVASILIAGIIYAGQSAIIFHTTTPYTFFWILMGIGMGLTMVESPPIKTIPIKISKSFSSYLMIALVVLSSFGIFLALKPLVANIYYYQGIQAQNTALHYINLYQRDSASLTDQQKGIYLDTFQDSMSTAISSYDKTLGWFSNEDRYRWSYAQALYYAGVYSPDPEAKERNCALIMELIDESIDMEPESAMLYYNRGLFKVQCFNDIDGGLEDLNKCIDMYPTGYMAYRLRAELYTEMGDLEQAVPDDEMALLIKPGDKEATLRLISNCLSLGKEYSRDDDPNTDPQKYYEKASEHANKASETIAGTMNVNQLMRLGNAFIIVGERYADDDKPDTDPMPQYESAISSLEKAVEKNPNEAGARYYLAIAYQGAGYTEQALSEYQQAIDMIEEYLRSSPGDALAHYMLGSAYERTGNTDEAIEHYQEALDINPDYHEARQALERLTQ